MQVPERIRLAAERLKQGRRVNRLTVRDFLRHFGAERRGAAIVEEIRAILDALSLETEPNFETAWIDGPIALRLKAGTIAEESSTMPEDSTRSDAETGLDEAVFENSLSLTESSEQDGALSTSFNAEEPKTSSDELLLSDPTFRIDSLPAAHTGLVSVNQSDSIKRAITLMLQHDFSQLPVMHGDRDAKGIVTWKSICSRQFLGRATLRVGDCMDDARLVSFSEPLFAVIPTIVEFGYVLVRGRDRTITGIVTSSDLSVQFAKLGEPFLLLREIELHVRQLLQNKLSADDFEVLNSAPSLPKRPEHLSELSFGQYVRLFERPEIWAKLRLQIDVAVLTELLEEVRVIRNEVMHFDPDPMTGDQLSTLKRAVRFMQQLYQLLPQDTQPLLLKA